MKYFSLSDQLFFPIENYVIKVFLSLTNFFPITKLCYERLFLS